MQMPQGLCTHGSSARGLQTVEEGDVQTAPVVSQQVQLTQLSSISMALAESDYKLGPKKLKLYKATKELPSCSGGNLPCNVGKVMTLVGQNQTKHAVK